MEVDADTCCLDQMKGFSNGEEDNVQKYLLKVLKNKTAVGTSFLVVGGHLSEDHESQIRIYERVKQAKRPIRHNLLCRVVLCSTLHRACCGALHCSVCYTALFVPCFSAVRVCSGAPLRV